MIYIKDEVEFYNIIFDILVSDKFRELYDEPHHGINRKQHSINVAKTTFVLSKRLGLSDYKELTRTALLHDLFENFETKNTIRFLSHPKIAAKNAKKLFNISNKQINIIETHMFPLTNVLPKSLDSLYISTIDKGVALYETAKYKIPSLLNKS